MLREVILAPDRDSQEFYLKATYQWYLKQQTSVGLMPKDQLAKENDFLNPAQVKAREEEEAIKIEEKRLEYMDDDKHDAFMREMF